MNRNRNGERNPLMKYQRIKQSLWHWSVSVPLRVKIIGIVLIATCLTASSVALWITYRFRVSGVPQIHFQILEEIFVAGLMAMVIGLVVAWFLTTILTKQVAEVTRVAEQVQAGDLSYRVPIHNQDEIGKLAQAFNAMMDSLIQSQESLMIANERHLEEVERRENIRTRLIATAVNAQEQERERISRELHDETGQALTALLIQLKVLEGLRDKEAIKHHVEALRNLVQETLEEVRCLARDLRPGTLDELGLVATIEWHLRNFGRNDKLGVIFDAHVPQDFRLPIHTELALYRVVQEALTNIVRHANATEAIIQLKKDEGRFCLCVQDDGCGFDVHTTMNDDKSGIGLLGIQERVELINGILKLESSEQGTRLEVVVPIEKAHVL